MQQWRQQQLQRVVFYIFWREWQIRWPPIHKPDVFFSCRHTQHPTNQLGPPPGHLPCFLPFSEEPEIRINKIASGFSKRSTNQQEIAEPGILVISKFFDHPVKRFPLRSVGLKGAVYRPCIPVQMSCMDFNRPSYPLFVVSSLQFLASSKALHPVGSPVSLLTWQTFSCWLSLRKLFSRERQTYIQCLQREPSRRWLCIVDIPGCSVQIHSPSCRNSRQEWLVQLCLVRGQRQLSDNPGMLWNSFCQPRPCQESSLHIHWYRGSEDTSGPTGRDLQKAWICCPAPTTGFPQAVQDGLLSGRSCPCGNSTYIAVSWPNAWTSGCSRSSAVGGSRCIWKGSFWHWIFQNCGRQQEEQLLDDQWGQSVPWSSRPSEHHCWPHWDGPHAPTFPRHHRGPTLADNQLGQYGRVGVLLGSKGIYRSLCKRQMRKAMLQCATWLIFGWP